MLWQKALLSFWSQLLRQSMIGPMFLEIPGYLIRAPPLDIVCRVETPSAVLHRIGLWEMARCHWYDTRGLYCSKAMAKHVRHRIQARFWWLMMKLQMWDQAFVLSWPFYLPMSHWSSWPWRMWVSKQHQADLISQVQVQTSRYFTAMESNLPCPSHRCLASLNPCTVRGSWASFSHIFWMATCSRFNGTWQLRIRAILKPFLRISMLLVAKS